MIGLTNQEGAQVSSFNFIFFHMCVDHHNGAVLNYNSINYIILLLLSKIYEIAYHSERSIRIAEEDGAMGLRVAAVMVWRTDGPKHKSSNPKQKKVSRLLVRVPS